ncbi:AI-2E family transporter [Gemmatimonadota bacterium DH-20]|uniref:AI-2E family transporter n=1 Tax=Gaopeijia maritima TaxID=3119007 RepID=A0ABU9E9R6_9BACT
MSPADPRHPLRIGVERFVLAALLLATLRIGRPVLLPLVSAGIATLLLLPSVRLLERLHLPRALASATVLLALVAGVAFGVSQLQGPAAEWMQRAPEDLGELQVKLQELREPVETVVEAADQVEEMAEGGGEEAAEVEVAPESGPSLSDRLLGMTWQTITFFVLLIVLVFFMLVGRERIVAKVVLLAPDSDAWGRVVSCASSIRVQLSTFVVTMTLINIGLGIGVGTALHLLGYPNPILWGTLVAVLNFVPYLGSATGILIVGVVGLLIFDTASPALGAMAIYLVLTSLEGTLISPALLSRRLSLDPVVTLVGILVMGFVWGVPGVLLTVPILVSVKVVAEHHEGGAMIAALIGEDHPAVPSRDGREVEGGPAPEAAVPS